MTPLKKTKCRSRNTTSYLWRPGFTRRLMPPTPLRLFAERNYNPLLLPCAFRLYLILCFAEDLCP